MNTLLSAQSISYRFTSEPLFENISCTLSGQHKIGLIGHNGCGKSTLLRLLDNSLAPDQGSISVAANCIISRVEQALPDDLQTLDALHAVLSTQPVEQHDEFRWQAEMLLTQMDFGPKLWDLPTHSLSGGQQTRLLLARALMRAPNLLLLDEPSNHLDLPTMLWLEEFLQSWSGAFVLVSHDQRLLDRATEQTWIMRDRRLHHFDLPCSAARQALMERDLNEAQQHASEQKEIDRLQTSAKRLATWGKVYDNENLARKAKTMEKRVSILEEAQTELTEGAPWQLSLQGQSMPADRLLALQELLVQPAADADVLFNSGVQQIRSGQRVALIGANGCGKSSLLRMLWQQYQHATQATGPAAIVLHPECRLGYYDQSLQQLADGDTLEQALRPYASLQPEAVQIDRRITLALINAGFAYRRHQQRVGELSGGERARLLFVALSLANYHVLLMDEPTNHLDLEGKEQLADALLNYPGAVILVTHDRALIEQACNRYWLVNDGRMQRWHDLPSLYAELVTTPSANDNNQSSIRAETVPALETSEDDLLDRLVTLESKLAADQARKSNHQKPKLQAAWQEEIAQLKRQLAFDE
ncbi:MAG: ABC-F family ATP-binding cassette domain-containing protein [Pseudomonadota bacterium]